MSKKQFGNCSVCGEYKQIAAYGMCWKHYARARRHNGDVSDPDYINSGKLCKIPNCTDEARSYGLCVKHYSRTKTHGDPYKVERVATYDGHVCIVPKCHEKPRTENLCHNHYHNYMYHIREGNVNDIPEYLTFSIEKEKKPKICTLSTCSKPIYGSGLCSTHYANFYYQKQRGKLETAEEYIAMKEAQ